MAEASGGITPETAPALAATGVDLLSVGWITHSAPSLDVALDLQGLCYPASMLPAAILLENYRAFSGVTTLELRPLTLLFGVNNSGKSALLRLLPLLDASVAPEVVGALDLASPAAREASFQDLRWKDIDEDENQDLGLGFRWSDLSVKFRITWFREWRRLMIRAMDVRDPAGSLLLALEWEPRVEERKAATHTYRIVEREGPGSPTVSHRLGFQGLVPTSIPEGIHHPLSDHLQRVKDRLRKFHGQVQWLQATRRPPERTEAAPTGPRRILRSDGRDAAAALFSDPDLLNSVSGWYEEQMGVRLHELEVPPGSFRLMLKNLERPELDLDLVDSGEGLIQVLPVLTALALAQREEGPRLLAIEEPESHLHPKLQRALASHLVRQVLGETAPRIVLETHSEHLLLGIQLEVARGNVRPEDVRIYWVHQLETGESLVEAIHLDDEAHLQGNWPPGVFSHDTEVAREIIRNRRERSRR